MHRQHVCGAGTKVRKGKEGGREEVEKARKRYLPGSHCLQASPGWVCSSVTETKRSKGRMNDRDSRGKEENMLPPLSKKKTKNK